WHARDAGAFGQVAQDGSAHAHHGAGADHYALHHAGPQSDVRAWADRNLPAEHGARSHMDVGADPAIVLDDSAGIDDDIVAQDAIGVDDGAGHHHEANSAGHRG